MSFPPLSSDCGNPPDAESSCTDGIDNDCDGLVDCADSVDCSGTPACQQADCASITEKKPCNAEATCR